MQKAWQGCTFVDFGQASFGQNGRAGWGGVDATDCAGVGLAQFGREVFRPWRPLEYKTMAGAYSRGCGTCTQYDPKVIVGVKTLDPKGDAYYGY